MLKICFLLISISIVSNSFATTLNNPNPSHIPAFDTLIVGNELMLSVTEENGGNSSIVQYPSVAYNSQEDEYLVVWAGKYNGVPNLGNDEAEIFGQLINAATGDQIGLNFRISDMGPNQNDTYGANAPKVVYNATRNEYMVIFYGDNNTSPIVNGEAEIYGQRLDADGNEIGENDFRISIMGDENEPLKEERRLFDGFFPDVTYNLTNDEYMVVWMGDNDTNGNFEIWAQRLNSIGQEIGTDFQVSFANLSNPTFINDDPIITWNPNLNQYLVVWHNGSFETKEYEIFGQLMDSTGFLLHAPFQISDAEKSATGAYATYNSNKKEYLVIWGEENEEDTQFLIKGKRYDENGDSLSSKIDLTDTGEEFSSFSDNQYAEVKYDFIRDEYVLVWSGNIGTRSEEVYNVHFVALDVNTAQPKIGTEKNLSSRSGDRQNNPSPALSLRPNNGEYLCVFSANDPMEIYGQRFSTNNPVILPVELLWFTGAYFNKTVRLKWKTSSETENKGFEVERSDDPKANQWEKIGFVKGNDTTLRPKDYEYLDDTPLSGVSYYRLKQINHDNKYEYSNLISITPNTDSDEIKVYPNPVKADQLNILFSKETDLLNIQLYDLLGRVVARKTITQTTQTQLDMSHLPKGIYTLLIQGKGQKNIQQIVIQ